MAKDSDPASATDPATAAAHHFRRQEWQQAADAYRLAIARQPNVPEHHDNLGMTLTRLGRLEEAASAFSAALHLRPDDPYAGINLGITLLHLEQLREAGAVFKKVLARQPDSAPARINAAMIATRLGNPDEAIELLQPVIEKDPSNSLAWVGLGNACKDRAEIETALACFRRALRAQPKMTVAQSNLLYTLYFHPKLDGHSLLNEHRRFQTEQAPAIQRRQLPAPTPGGNRRLNIGYISPHFRTHCTSHFTLPLFRSHDKSRFHIHCYSDVARPDATTGAIRAAVETWRDINAMSDERAAPLIADDQIDILVDLTLHMEGGRPLLMARKPAHVQISWLGYPGTSGLSAMDWRLSTRRLDPPGADSNYLEKTWRLPNTYWCYDPLTNDLNVAPLPALAAGYVTFGCLNHFSKGNDDVIRLFMDVLKSVQNSRLLIVAPPGTSRANVLSRAASVGIEPSRIEFIDRQPWIDYMHVYDRIDIALDPFPWNGHTTSFDGLWMGVPMITLPGQSAVSRGGVEILTQLNHPQFIAKDAADYIRIAQAAAGDLPRLASVRNELRQRMKQSAMMNAGQFARDIEAAYEHMWQDCASRFGVV